MNRIVVVDIYGQELPGIPTPALMEARGGEAYFSPNENEATKTRLPGVWYLRAPGYESPTGEYRRVRIVLASEGNL